MHTHTHTLSQQVQAVGIKFQHAEERCTAFERDLAEAQQQLESLEQQLKETREASQQLQAQSQVGVLCLRFEV